MWPQTVTIGATMKKFILLIRSEDKFAQLSPADIQSTIGKYRSWAQKMREEGRLIDAEGLKDGGKVLTGSAGGIITDGPFPETKEMVGGYYVFTADSMEQAEQIARDCPALSYGGSVELRQSMDYE
jgi:hypothetical protein